MAVERILHCDNRPGCTTHIRTATPPPYLPAGWLLVKEGNHEKRVRRHFCGWECIIQYGAKLEPPTVIET
jgi:hypothetical protein